MAAFFTWWKSPAAEVAIALWNEHAWWTVGRTIDWSDLLSLPAVLLAVLYFRWWQPSVILSTRWRPLLRGTVAAIGFLVFAATSYRSPVTYDFTYSYSGSADALIHALRANRIAVSREGAAGQMELSIPSDFCFEEVYASVALKADGRSTRLLLQQITHHCPRSKQEYQELLKVFEVKVARPLRLRRDDGIGAGWRAQV